MQYAAISYTKKPSFSLYGCLHGNTDSCKSLAHYFNKQPSLNSHCNADFREEMDWNEIARQCDLVCS